MTANARSCKLFMENGAIAGGLMASRRKNMRFRARTYHRNDVTAYQPNSSFR